MGHNGCLMMNDEPFIKTFDRYICVFSEIVQPRPLALRQSNVTRNYDGIHEEVEVQVERYSSGKSQGV